MPRCNRCGASSSANELVRHEAVDLLMVYCPSCHALLGTYREPGRGR